MILLLACTIPFPERTFVQNPGQDYDGDGVTEAHGDCDDTQAAVYPAADEHCDGLDNDCDGKVDADDDDTTDLLTGYVDVDGDGFGDAARVVQGCSLESMGGGLAVMDSGDCDDADGAVNPGVEEICGNGLDDNCDASTSGCGWEDVNPLTHADLILRGDDDGDAAGWAMTNGRDVDGDGTNDFAIGLPGKASETTVSCGMIAVMLSTQKVPASGALSDAGTVLYADYTSANLGSGLAWFRGDGDDVSLLAGSTSGAGAASYPGGAVTLIPTPYSGFLIGDSDPLDTWYSLSPGDLGGDRVADARSAGSDEAPAFLVSAELSGNGAIYLIEPGVEGSFQDTARTVIVGDDNALLGANPPVVGDVNGDGLDDLIIGAPEYQTTGGGAAVILLGPRSSWGSSVVMDDADVLLVGEENSGFGRTPATGDLDDDGLGDLILVADRREEGSLIFGYTDGIPGSSSTVSWEEVQADASFTLTGPPPSGAGLDLVGDFDDDGQVDLAIGAHRERDGAGEMYVVSGPFAGTSDMAEVGITFSPEPGANQTGLVITGLGDVSGDGLPDLAVAAPGRGASDNPGAVYVLFGRPGQ